MILLSDAVQRNRIPEAKRNDMIEFALEYEELTPRELAIKYTDEKGVVTLTLDI